MGAHPDAARRDLAQQRVEICAVAPLVNRVDPDEHAIERGEPCAHGVEDIVLVDHRLRFDATSASAAKTALNRLVSGVALRRAASSPRHRIAMRPRRAVGSHGKKHSAFIIVLLPA